MRLPILISAIAILLQAGTQPTPPQSTDYATRARRAVEDELRKSGQPPDAFRIEILGDPGPLLDHARFHRQVAEPPAGRARLSGRVVTAMWESAPGISVSLVPAGANTAEGVAAVTSGVGEFQFPDVAPGDYQMQFEGSPDSRKRVTLDEGRKRVVAPLGGSDLYSPFARDESSESPIRVFAAIYRGTQLEKLNDVEFRGSRANVSTMLDPKEPDTEFGVASFLTDAEWKQASADGAAVIDALFDVTRGPERLRPFLSSRVVCRIYYSGERRIPSIDQQRCAMYLLDSFALSLWFQVESFDGYRGQTGLDWYDEPRGASEEVMVAVAARRHEVLREELRNAGMFEREHLARIQQYFRSVMVVMPAKLKVTLPSREFPLPQGDLYMLPLPFFLIREGQGLRIAGAFQAGG